MINRVMLYPYRAGSGSVRNLRQQDLGVPARSIKVENSTYRNRPNHLVVNWGCSQLPEWWAEDTVGLNHPAHVAVAGDKLATFIRLQEAGVKIPEFTTSIDEVATKGWADYVIRTTLTGHSARGTYLASEYDGDPSTTGRLFVEYIKKYDEYRIHVFDGKVVDVQQKKLSRDRVDEGRYHNRIRSHGNGWVFTRAGVEAPDEVKEQSVLAVQALDLDFGAVDVVWNTIRGAYVLEVNTAPGIEATTLETYTQCIKQHIENLNED